MKVLKFNFNHPFKGKANLVQMNSVSPQKQSILIDNDGLVEIPIGACQAGKWRLVLDWTYEERAFCYQENFEVTDHLGGKSVIRH